MDNSVGRWHHRATYKWHHRAALGGTTVPPNHHLTVKLTVSPVDAVDNLRLTVVRCPVDQGGSIQGASDVLANMGQGSDQAGEAE